MKVVTEELLKCFTYDPLSPSSLSWNIDIFCGKHGRIKKVSKGDNCTYVSNGRYVVMYKHRAYQVSRIVYFLHNPKADQTLEVDHKNGDTLNNNIDNLRLVSRTINSRNVKRRKSTEKTGVQFRTVNGYSYYIARYTDLNGVRHDKTFSCLVFGQDEAKEMAYAYRDMKIAELNTQGATYTERHGTG